MPNFMPQGIGRGPVANQVSSLCETASARVGVMAGPIWTRADIAGHNDGRGTVTARIVLLRQRDPRPLPYQFGDFGDLYLERQETASFLPVCGANDFRAK